MSCWRCGEQLPGGARFCGQCGASQDAAARPESAAPPAAEPAPPRSAPPEAAPESPRASRSATASPSPVPAGPAAAPLVGRTIAGRYRLLRLVGEGGMGSVYEAEQTLGSTARSVAVKLLRPEWSHDPAVQARFHREAATVARLEHFNTVRVYDFGTTDDGILFIVMEFLHGRSLQQELDRVGALPPERVLHLAQQIAASLDEAHGLGIVHRDLKPENILLLDSYASQQDVAKIVDFGIAKGQPALGSTTKLTELGAFVGTPAYMSPEQFMGGSVGPQSDVYALGVTTWQMLTGRLPFAAETVVEWARAHLETAPPALGEQHGAGRIPEAMRRAVARALSKSPGDRQSGALEFARELAGRSEVQGARPGEARVEDAARRAERALAEALVPSGGLKTAPMTRLPDLGAEPERDVPTTQAMAANAAARQVAAAAPYVSAPNEFSHRDEGRAERRGSRAVIWLIGTAAVVSGLGLVFVALGGERYLTRNEPDVAPPAWGSSPPTEPARPEPEPEPEPEPAPAPEPEPEPARPSPPPPRPRPQPAPPAPAAVPPAVPPAAVPPAAVPPAAVPPGTTGGAPSTLPGAAGAPPVPVPPVPQVPGPPIPWSLPTAGACERCAQALQGSGNYTVVTAIAENLLCEDTNARILCERQIVEAAPAVAERAARSGDCPAALATAAAAVNFGVPAERFLPVNAMCLR